MGTEPLQGEARSQIKSRGQETFEKVKATWALTWHRLGVLEGTAEEGLVRISRGAGPRRSWGRGFGDGSLGTSALTEVNNPGWRSDGRAALMVPHVK